MLKVLVSDDHPLFREALIGALQAHFSKAKFYEADSLESSILVLDQYRAISLILLDLNMPGGENFYGLLKLRQRYPQIPIAVVSASEANNIVSQSMEFGASAYIPKTTPTHQIVSVLDKVLLGETWLPETYAKKIKSVTDDVRDAAEHIRRLTPKQYGVLSLLRKGFTNKQISDKLNVTEATVKAHISAIFRQFDVKSRTQVLVKIENLQLE